MTTFFFFKFLNRCSEASVNMTRKDIDKTVQAFMTSHETQVIGETHEGTLCTPLFCKCDRNSAFIYIPIRTLSLHPSLTLSLNRSHGFNC